MAGHNKWSKVKHKKAVTDAQKSKVFGKMAKLITAASKKVNGNREDPDLKQAIERARSANMPNDNIDRAIKRGTDSDAAELEPVVYEAYGPGGVAIMIHGLTDNRNRAAAEIKHVLTKHNLTLAEQGAASWAFQRASDGTYEPMTTVPVGADDSEKLERLREDLEDNDDVQEVYTNAAV